MGSSESKPVALTPASVPEMNEKRAILDDQRRRFTGGASDKLDLAQVAQWDKSLKAVSADMGGNGRAKDLGYTESPNSPITSHPTRVLSIC